MKSAASKAAEKNNYKPYVTDGSTKHGGSGVILLMGAILAAIFSASTAYSGMKAGLTVAAGIPGSIIGAGLVAAFAKSKGILGKNILQGMSSGGESIASGMIYVLPAIIIIGGKVNFLAGIIVGSLAVLFAIGIASLVQNYLVVQEHGKLIYPEAVAINDALVTSESGGDSLKFMGIGFAVGGIITMLTTQFFSLVNSTINYVGNASYRWKWSTEVNPMLAGIGFVIGIQVALTMFAGSFLANFGITPLICYFTHLAGSGVHVWNDASITVKTMNVDAVAGSYSRYIGAGMMLCGGIVGAIKLIPVIGTSIKQTMNAKGENDGSKSNLGMIGLLIAIIAIFFVGFFISGNILMAIVGGILSLLLALLFVIVSARMAGTIGCSNNPVSGMTIASLVIMTLFFAIFGWKSNAQTQVLLMFGVFIVTAISVGAAYVQTQKVNYLVGGNKNEVTRYFMIAAIIGVIIEVGTTVLLEPQLRIQGSNPPFGLPQANLIATLTSGILSGNLPWVMVIVGIVMGLVCQMVGLSIMTVALGFYLPMSTTTVILIGALLRFFIEKVTKDKALRKTRVSQGISLSTGLICGGSILGLVGIILHVTGVLKDKTLTGFAAGNGVAFILLIVMIIGTVWPLLTIKHADNANSND
ncbi:OPT/YSL family transporter [Limosilactobacillus difficilis]|uniref:OPT/YSL family transporter n=1 Tax=Limosilactobacillus difficilis TaxID=2991838 RepID=UPI0024BB262F|nr:OPT/YSL family transporter [Limosilactobacillus difficilis]